MATTEETSAKASPPVDDHPSVPPPQLPTGLSGAIAFMQKHWVFVVLGYSVAVAGLSVNVYSLHRDSKEEALSLEKRIVENEFSEYRAQHWRENEALRKEKEELLVLAERAQSAERLAKLELRRAKDSRLRARFLYSYSLLVSVEDAPVALTWYADVYCLPDDVECRDAQMKSFENQIYSPSGSLPATHGAATSRFTPDQAEQFRRLHQDAKIGEIYLTEEEMLQAIAAKGLNRIGPIRPIFGFGIP